jgi:hypothetical protein
MPIPEPWGLVGQAFGLLDGAIIAVPSEGITLFRLVLNDPPDRSDFEPLSRLYAEKRGVSELDRTGLSLFATVDQAEAIRWKDGQRIASITVEPSARIHLARTDEARPGHHQAWVPTDLLQRLLETAEVVR